MMDGALVYRCCDRPEYAAHTFPQLIKTTSTDVGIIMFDNSGDAGNAKAYKDVFDEYGDSRCRFYSHGSRMGVNYALVKGISLVEKVFPGEYIKYLFTVDDDVLTPDTTEANPPYWDRVLADVLSKGKYWTVAFKAGQEDVKPENLKQRDGYQMLERGAVSGGGCTASRLDILRANPFPKVTDIFTYGHWMSTVCKGRCAYVEYENEHIGRVRSVSIDNIHHPFSLRNSKYNDYSNAIWHHRHPRTEGERPRNA